MGVRRRRDMTEVLSALAACLIAAVVANWRLLHPGIVSADALVHQYWMWHWKDAGLFNDPLTAELRHSARYPDGYQALFWLASHVADPIAFGELVGVGLMALSGFLVFLIVREHTPWRPAAWIGAALFMAPFEIHRFYGGFPRAFVHPVVLLTVLLALRRRHLAASLVAAAGALFYPPAAVLAVGTLIVSARLDRRRLAYAGLAFVLMLVAVLAPGAGPRVMTANEARAFPEFGEHGPLHFFVPSLIDYLRDNRSGFDLRTAGSILAVAAVAALLARRGNWRLLRVEVWAMAISVAGRVRGLAGRAVPPVSAAPLHVSAARLLRDRDRGHPAADVDGADRPAAAARRLCAAGRAGRRVRVRRLRVPARPAGAARDGARGRARRDPRGAGGVAAQPAARGGGHRPRR